MSPPVLGHHDYTVAWFCQSAIDRRTAESMLDQRHAPLPKLPNDPNAYTLGSMAGLNVVLFSPPLGLGGHPAAASVTAWMRSTFPSVTFGLVVGVAGGFPHRVRLGDVVIATSVYTWDLGPGWTNEDGMFHNLLAPNNNPPAALMTAAVRFFAELPSEPGRAPGRKLQKGVERPDVALNKRHQRHDPVDVWFPTGTPHLVIADEDYPCSQCDKTQAVVRDPRPPTVRIGVLVSRNFDIALSHLRDSMSVHCQGTVLCFDTQSGGVVNYLPCLVVRGISSYADEHSPGTSRIWDHYASANAAAVAKRILCFANPGAPTDWSVPRSDDGSSADDDDDREANEIHCNGLQTPAGPSTSVPIESPGGSVQDNDEDTEAKEVCFDVPEASSPGLSTSVPIESPGDSVQGDDEDAEVKVRFDIPEAMPEASTPVPIESLGGSVQGNDEDIEANEVRFDVPEASSPVPSTSVPVESQSPGGSVQGDHEDAEATKVRLDVPEVSSSEPSTSVPIESQSPGGSVQGDHKDAEAKKVRFDVPEAPSGPSTSVLGVKSPGDSVQGDGDGGEASGLHANIPESPAGHSRSPSAESHQPSQATEAVPPAANDGESHIAVAVAVAELPRATWMPPELAWYHIKRSSGEEFALITPIPHSKAPNPPPAGRWITLGSLESARHPLDFGAHITLLSQRHPETGGWFLDSKQYQRWIKRRGQTLYCRGAPGAGKSVLAAMAVNEIATLARTNPTIAVAALYDMCWRRGLGRDREVLEARLLMELISASYVNGKGKDKAHSTPQLELVVQSNELTSCLKAWISRFTRTYIILDGVEPSFDRDGIRDCLLAMASLQLHDGANLLITTRARDNALFTECLDVVGRSIPMKTSGTSLPMTNGLIDMEIRADEGDVEKCLSGAMGRLDPSLHNNTGLHGEIKEAVWGSCAGVFLAAEINFEMLHTKPNAKKIRKMLASLRKQSVAGGNHAEARYKASRDALDAAYDRVIGRMLQAPDLPRLVTFLAAALEVLERTNDPIALEQVYAKWSEGGRDTDPPPSIIQELMARCGGALIYCWIFGEGKEDGLEVRIRLLHHTFPHFVHKLVKALPASLRPVLEHYQESHPALWDN